jgi:predicted RNase H-like nuclease (RuvC/YqgF family)
MNGLQDNFETMRRDNATLSNQISSLTAENETLQQQITTLIEERNSAETLAANLGQEKSDLEAELTAVLAQNEDLQEEVTAVQALNNLLQNDLANSTEIIALFTSPETQQALLPGTETQPQAEGHLLFDPETNVAILFVDDMPTLTQGQVYQVLLIRDDGHDTAETFAVDVSGQQALIVHAQAPLNTFTSVGVSIEPEGGSPQRTGDVILLGQLANS